MSETKNYVLGRGKLYFDPFRPGTTETTGEYYLGNTSEFNLSVESDSLDHYGSEEGVRTKDDTVTLELNRSGNIVTDNISKENVARFILGEVSDYVQSATPVVDENIGVVLKDRYYQLGKTTSNPQGVRNVSAVTVTLDPSGTPVTLTEGTDYTIDLELGRIYFLESGANVDGLLDAEVDYTPAAETRIRITSNSTVSQEGALRYVAHNAKGSDKDVYIASATLKPSGDWALKGDDWQNLAFDLEVGELAGVPAIMIDGRAVS